MRKTETASPRYRGLDTWENQQILEALWEGQKMAAVAAVGPALPALDQAVTAMVERLRRNGRLIYVGAGASGHLAIQDGMEMPQTFGWPANRLVFLMAGGDAARLNPTGHAEDDGGAAQRDLEAAEVSPDDVVIGVAASGSTAFTVAALVLAKDKGALTNGIANNAATPLLRTSIPSDSVGYRRGSDRRFHTHERRYGPESRAGSPVFPGDD